MHHFRSVHRNSRNKWGERPNILARITAHIPQDQQPQQVGDYVYDNIRYQQLTETPFYELHVRRILGVTEQIARHEKEERHVECVYEPLGGLVKCRMRKHYKVYGNGLAVIKPDNSLFHRKILICGFMYSVVIAAASIILWNR